MDYQAEFERLYEHYEKLIANGDLNGDDFDRSDSVLSILYQMDDDLSGIFESLSSDDDRAKFLNDWQITVGLLSDPGSQQETENVIANKVRIMR